MISHSLLPKHKFCARHTGIRKFTQQSYMRQQDNEGGYRQTELVRRLCGHERKGGDWSRQSLPKAGARYPWQLLTERTQLAVQTPLPT